MHTLTWGGCGLKLSPKTDKRNFLYRFDLPRFATSLLSLKLRITTTPLLEKTHQNLAPPPYALRRMATEQQHEIMT